MNFLSFPVLVVASAALLVVHIMLQAQLTVRELGHRWNVGARDEGLKPKGVLAGRAERTLRNFQETYPIFIGLALALALMEPMSSAGHVGAYIWLIARIAYIPLYLGGVPYLRSLVWLAAMGGLGLMAAAVVV